ncbi:hypothetical protein EFK50_07885 [Nocardioides marmoriginsengisoli]|uniref:Uncharacterized protein n=1 Tax=Nocardioides marmoriginsengisoli TaxID=661483 RepID=A0A3N0CJN5_9ACTN|nr:hypothetical protein [Nocardioides marmoriginsengisoli]RNL63654.1 hypothetical protein EFK50_07885 [Nocardioides marmoriginsengisoli]
MISNPQHALTFGALNLIGTDADQAANGYQFQALGDDRDWGNPVPIEQKITSWLQDGAIVALTGQDNRQMFLRIQVLADDSNGLALAEQALMFESYRRNLLTWTPPDGLGEPCVFTVVMSSFDEVTDDLDDLRVIATYGLKIQALPYVRSQDLVSVTIPAPSLTPQTFTVIDDCSSPTNWTQTKQEGSGSPVTSAPGSDGQTLYTTNSTLDPWLVTRFALTRSGLATSMAAKPFVRVDGYAGRGGGATFAPGTTAPTFKLNGVDVPVATQEGYIYWLDAAAAGVTTLNSIEMTGHYVGPGQGNLGVLDVSQSNVLGTQGTNRQIPRLVDVAGSARTPASLAIEDASVALGTALIYTCPIASGMEQPNIRRFLASGPSPVTDASTIYGATSSLSTQNSFDVPVGGLQEGGHLLVARVKHASSGAYTLTWGARSRQGSSSLGDAQTGTTPVTLVAGAWKFVVVASLNLPPRKMGSSGKVRIELLGSTGVVLDELWLFNTDIGRLTWVECGTATPAAGGSANRLFLDSPTLEHPEYTVYLGTAADRSDAFHAGNEMVSFGAHEFAPPQMNIFTITSNSQAAAITLSHYRNFHTRVTAA